MVENKIYMPTTVVYSVDYEDLVSFEVWPSLSPIPDWGFCEFNEGRFSIKKF